MSTANDAEERDPLDWELMGTNDPITSVAHGTGLRENWSAIASGTLALPAARLTAGDPVTFASYFGPGVSIGGDSATLFL